MAFNRIRSSLFAKPIIILQHHHQFYRTLLSSSSTRAANSPNPRPSLILRRPLNRQYAQQLNADDSISEAQWRKTFFTWKTLGLALVPLTCFMLGTWQVKRLKWKSSLINEINHKIHQEPVPLPLNLT